VPELPEVEALARFLGERIIDRRVDRCELASFSALKTFDPPIAALLGLTGRRCRRRGKFLCLEFDDIWLVVHLARGGWVRWYDRVPAARARPSNAPLALRVGLSTGDVDLPGPGFDLTEAGTEKRLAIWVVRDPAEVGLLAQLGVDPLDPSFDTPLLSRLLAAAPGTIKSALTSQSLIAGVGNAYSDEVLHACRLSPFRPARKLSSAEVDQLRVELVAILGMAVERSAAIEVARLKGEKKGAMRIHGRTGEACPVCGDLIRDVSFATRSYQYCATCQTGGKALADRRLSRLLK
jgi:formamidopyrimidine-DNA glycosylase